MLLSMTAGNCAPVVSSLSSAHSFQQSQSWSFECQGYMAQVKSNQFSAHYTKTFGRGCPMPSRTLSQLFARLRTRALGQETPSCYQRGCTTWSLVLQAHPQSLPTLSAKSTGNPRPLKLLGNVCLCSFAGVIPSQYFLCWLVDSKNAGFGLCPRVAKVDSNRT